MVIAGLKFRLVKGTIFYNCSGVLIYKHKTSERYFVRAMKNCRMQRSKNNYPVQLKKHLKAVPGEVIIYMAQTPQCNREALMQSYRAVSKELSDKGLLYKDEEATHKSNVYSMTEQERAAKWTVWSMTHKDTGAVFYFKHEAGECVQESVQQRFKTFDTYVEANIVHANRTMHSFAKQYWPLVDQDWVVRDLGLSFDTEAQAKTCITKLTKTHLEQGEVVLNRVCDMDALYYRNHIIKLTPQVNMETYLQQAA